MLPPELFYNPQYQALTPAAGRFYIFLNVYRESEEQRACLFEALTEYNRLYDLGLSDFDIQNEARPTKGSKYNQGYFVAPMKHLEAAGFKKNYVTKLKKELIDKGFIKINQSDYINPDYLIGYDYYSVYLYGVDEPRRLSPIGRETLRRLFTIVDNDKIE